MKMTFLADESGMWALWLAASFILSPVSNILRPARRRPKRMKHAR